MLALNPPHAVRDIIEQALRALDATRLRGTPAPATAHRRRARRSRCTSRWRRRSPARCPPGALLFVAARDPQVARARRSPSKRLPAQFPVDVELTAADAMLESRRITAGQQLEVVARVALGGTPTATSGDPFGQVSYHVGKDGKLNIVIDRLRLP